MAKTKKTKSSVETTGNKELDKMLAVMAEAKKSGEKNVVVFTTERKHYKKEMASELGFSAGDLKPKFYEAYKYFLCNHDATTRLLNPEELAVEWIVKLK